MSIVIKNARLSFPSLFKASAFEEGKEPSFSAAFLLDVKKNASDIKALQAALTATLVGHYGSEKAIPKGFKLCLRDGSEKDQVDGYGAGVKFFSASSKKRVPIVDKDKSPLTEEDGRPYAGCYVNVCVRFWVQDNKWGKKVNAALEAVQFVKDGEPFGGGVPVDVESTFDDLSGADDGDEGNSLL